MKGASARKTPRRGPASVGRALVEWRCGVHLVGTPLWCDAARARGACFVSSALAAQARGHRQIIATNETLQLLPADQRRAARMALAVPCGRPFSLGAHRLELFPSGSMVGAASLAVDVEGTRVVYAGAVNPGGQGLAGAAEIRSCDVLVVDAAFGHPRFRFPPVAVAMAEVAAWVEDAMSDGATPVLLASPLGLGADLIRLLGGGRCSRVVAHRAFVDAARRLGALGHALPAVRRFAGAPGAGAVLLWPLSSRKAPALAAVRRPRLALVGGSAQDPAAVSRLRVDAAFAWSDRADHDALLGYVLQSGARQVHVLGGGEELARELGARGVEARVLGPPRQLELF